MSCVVKAMIGAGTLLFACPARAASPDLPPRFDMACHGHSSVTAKGVAPLDKPDDSRMSVDLERRLWCWRKGEGCFQVIAVQRVEGHVIMLRDEDGAKGDSHIRLDLTDGHLTSHLHIKQQATPAIPDIIAVVDSHCTMAPYSAIP